MQLPPASGVLDAAPSGLDLHDVITQHARESAVCHANTAQLRALQRWVREQEKLGK